MLTSALLLDCETTGLPNDWRAPSSDFSNWPRLVQLCWAVADATGKVLATDTSIVHPVGFTIPDDSVKIHGITTERAASEGRDLAGVLADLTARYAECGQVVAHNARFDRKVLEAEYLRSQLPIPWADHKDRWKCSMFATVKMCGLRQPSGAGKFPRIDELYKRLFRKVPASLEHDAGNHVGILVECWQELKRRRVWK
jgi:DNA polymerase-3 subunit epsilon